MSLFQCSKCGCIDNTVTSRHGYEGIYRLIPEDVLKSYREVLKLKPEDNFGIYCCVCSPIWFDENGKYGIGPKPEIDIKLYEWHNIFPRRFLPLGEWITDEETGNLKHKTTGEKNYYKYIIKEE